MVQLFTTVLAVILPSKNYLSSASGYFFLKTVIRLFFLGRDYIVQRLERGK